MQKLKWYDCSSYRELPDEVKGVRFECGLECFDFIHVEKLNDIIAYTLGEPLEIDCSACKHDGGQSWFPSGCTGCFANKDFQNYEPLEGDK